MLVASPPLLRLLGMIAALTKDKNAVVALNNVNGGGRKRIDEFFINFALIRTLYRAHDKRRLLSRYGTQPQRLHTLLPRPKGREMCINKGQWGMGTHRLLRSYVTSLADTNCLNQCLIGMQRGHSNT